MRFYSTRPLLWTWLCQGGRGPLHEPAARLGVDSGPAFFCLSNRRPPKRLLFSPRVHPSHCVATSLEAAAREIVICSPPTSTRWADSGEIPGALKPPSPHALLGNCFSGLEGRSRTLSRASHRTGVVHGGSPGTHSRPGDRFLHKRPLTVSTLFLAAGRPPLLHSPGLV